MKDRLIRRSNHAEKRVGLMFALCAVAVSQVALAEPVPECRKNNIGNGITCICWDWGCPKKEIVKVEIRIVFREYRDYDPEFIRNSFTNGRKNYYLNEGGIDF